MKNFRYISSIPQQEEYEDPLRNEKGILTDFVNYECLKYNHNELELMNAIYTTMNRILDKSGLMLVFKGGNVMRLINKNLKDNLTSMPEKIIMDIFEPFLKQSDNDFTIFVNPNKRFYEKYVLKLSDKLFLGLKKIRKDIMSDLPRYFEFFRLNKEEQKNIMNDYRKELEAKKLRFNPTTDKYIILDDPDDPTSDVLVYESTTKKKNFLYNSLNLSLEFPDPRGDPIKFYLLRTKMNFLVNQRNIAGELIDISIPHKNDSNMAKLNTTKKFKKYLRENIYESYNEEYGFTYYVVNIHYLIKDLHRILFEQFEFPWSNQKYNKRIARLIYFIFIDYLNTHPFSLDTLIEIISDYDHFMDQISKSRHLEFNKNPYLQNIFDSTILLMNKITSSESKQFRDYRKLLMDYSEAIIRICNAIYDYMSGNEELEEKDLYELDIV